MTQPKKKANERRNQFLIKKNDSKGTYRNMHDIEDTIAVLQIFLI